MLSTPRLRLHHWDSRHREAFAAMHADIEVMADLGGAISRQVSDEKFDRYAAALKSHTLSRWAVEDVNGEFLGYSGVMPRMTADHPLGPHFEIGWRFKRSAWGNGYATESAKAALIHAVRSVSIDNIVSYTSTENLRSQSVMRKLQLMRNVKRDFVLSLADGGSVALCVWQVPVELYSS